MSDIVERLHEACNGHPHAKIAWPHRLLHDAVAEIERLRAEVKERREFGANLHGELFASTPLTSAEDAPYA